jgi:hypothetical protein
MGVLLAQRFSGHGLAPRFSAMSPLKRRVLLEDACPNPVGLAVGGFFDPCLSSLMVEPHSYFSVYQQWRSIARGQWAQYIDRLILTGCRVFGEARAGHGKGKTEGGHKRGHSAMALWVTHQRSRRKPVGWGAPGQAGRKISRRLLF